MFKYLSYVSHQSHSLTDAALEKILSRARLKNEAEGITGMLICYEGLFIQFLEGEEEKINELFDKITSDQRHNQILILDDGYSETRKFGDWSMAFEKLDHKKAEKIIGFKEFNKKDLFAEAKDEDHPALQLLQSFVNDL
ncbi:MAG TPA: BLUF domain-containing protein [Salegentibacter sp.]|nr:BLUF domain-containing protein [Salegentibacter sp.]